MDVDRTREAIVNALRNIAPEIEPDQLTFDRPLREQVDLDSMDWLNFLVGLEAELGVAVPESEYRRLVTLDDLVRYVLDAPDRD